jgi:4-hydroxymandelate oxidase
MSQFDQAANRRRFLRYLAASSLVAYGGGSRLAHALEAPDRLPDPMEWAPRDLDHLITSPKAAINVFDFEPVMKANVLPGHFGYMASGIDDDATLRANREGFQKFKLRPRRLVDVSKIDMNVELFGQKYPSPIIVAPTGGHRAYYPEGEIATAKGAKAGDHLMILSTQTSTAIEDVAAARGRPIWYQLYATNKFEVAKAHVERAEKAGCIAVAVTVDATGGRNQEVLFRLARADPHPCQSCHETPTGPSAHEGMSGPMYKDVDISGLANIAASALTWDYLKRIRDATTMKCVVKGILSAEDAKMAADAGYDGIIVSNHGGRNSDAVGSTIEALPDIISAAGSRTTVLIDSGFRRGTDIVKALAMGASGVAVGRPYLWGLGAFGEPGVERVLELLRTELAAAMGQVGAPSIKDLVPAMVKHV